MRFTAASVICSALLFNPEVDAGLSPLPKAGSNAVASKTGWFSSVDVRGGSMGKRNVLIWGCI